MILTVNILRNIDFQLYVSVRFLIRIKFSILMDYKKRCAKTTTFFDLLTHSSTEYVPFLRKKYPLSLPKLFHPTCLLNITNNFVRYRTHFGAIRLIAISYFVSGETLHLFMILESSLLRAHYFGRSSFLGHFHLCVLPAVDLTVTLFNNCN